MKLLILRNNVTNNTVVDQGLALVKQQLDAIGFPLQIVDKTISATFHGLTTKNAEGGTISMVNPNEIASYQTDNDAVFLVYDADKVTPRPTNPVDNGTIMQMPTFWFANYPETFSDYFLHELCHYLFFKAGQQDYTHLIVNRNINPALYDQLQVGQKPANQFYMYIIKSLKSSWGAAPVATTTTLKQGSKGDLVKELQALLGVVVDGDFGPKTKAAVVAFQKASGLVADGIVGPKTWTELKKKVSVTITRTTDTGKQTLGELVAINGGKTFKCRTIELPWKDNQRMISCIPKGTYLVKMSVWAGKTKKFYLLQNVPGRGGIFMHEGNYYYNYQGCIGLGKDLVDMNRDGQLDVTATTDTVKAFETFMEGKDFTLTIQ